MYNKYSNEFKKVVSIAMIFALLFTAGVYGEASGSNIVKPTSSKVLVDYEEISFEAYNINGSNYFKLRDLAKVVNGTDKQFEVKWNNDKGVIELVSDTPYTEVGGELAPGDGKSKTATLNASIIYKDGKELKLQAYRINGNNYFKLRDIAKVFDFGVFWDDEAKTVGIDTDLGYTPDISKLKITKVTAINNNTQLKIEFDRSITEEEAGNHYFSVMIPEIPSYEFANEIKLEAGKNEAVLDLEVTLQYDGIHEFYLHGSDQFVKFNVKLDSSQGNTFEPLTFLCLGL